MKYLGQREEGVVNDMTELCSYLIRTPEQSDADAIIEEKISVLVAEAKSRLRVMRERKKKESTKEWLIAYFAKGIISFKLEKKPGFRWLDRLDGRGHQMFKMTCEKCKGAGKVPKDFFPQETSECSSCHGTGKETGPKYGRHCSHISPEPSGPCLKSY